MLHCSWPNRLQLRKSEDFLPILAKEEKRTSMIPTQIIFLMKIVCEAGVLQSTVNLTLAEGRGILYPREMASRK